MNWKHIFYKRRSATTFLEDLKVESDGLTDIGLKRTINRDAYMHQDQPAVLVVANGMGGHAGGEVAAHQTIRHFYRSLTEAQDDTTWIWPSSWGPKPTLGNNHLLRFVLEHAVTNAHQQILALAERDSSLKGMGTTFTGGVIEGGVFYWVQVGDSRLYHFRNGGFTQVSEDQTFANMASNGLVNRELDEIELQLYGSMLTQSIGGERLTPIHGTLELAPGDSILICSDGLTKMVADSKISGVLANIAGLRNQLEQLILLANQNGGEDNVTAIIAKIS